MWDSLKLDWNGNSSSSSLLVAMSRWRADSRAVVFKTMYRGQRDTRLCPYLINCANLYPLAFPQLLESSFLIPILYYSIPSLSDPASTSALSLAPYSSIPACSCHRTPNRYPCFLSAASQRSRSNHVAIYYATVFCLLRMYVFIGSNPACALSPSALAASTKV